MACVLEPMRKSVRNLIIETEKKPKESNKPFKWNLLTLLVSFCATYMSYKIVLTFTFADEILNMTIQMKAIEQYFLVVLFISKYTGGS